MTRMCDLSTELVEEIFARVPITSLKSVRSTCKLWNNLSKEWILGKAVDRKHYLGFMMVNMKVYSVRFDLQGIHKEDKLVFTSRKKIDKLNQFAISKISHCEGLVLCVTEQNSALVMWNPYLCQIRKIDSRKNFDSYNMYCLGYDKNRNYKILKYSEDGFEYKIYDLCSNSWRVSNRREGIVIQSDNDVSLKGNTYFVGYEYRSYTESYLLCFDFTKERFGKRLRFPFLSRRYDDIGTLSCVREEKLAVLYHQKIEAALVMTVEIWVTSKIEPNAVSWIKFLKFNSTSVSTFVPHFIAWRFFINEEKKFAVVFDRRKTFIIGEDGYFQSLSINSRIHGRFPYSTSRPCLSVLTSSYVPSLVQISQTLKRKERDA